MRISRGFVELARVLRSAPLRRMRKPYSADLHGRRSRLLLHRMSVRDSWPLGLFFSLQIFLKKNLRVTGPTVPYRFLAPTSFPLTSRPVVSHPKKKKQT